MTELWLVGQWRQNDEPWEVQGIFSTEDLAVAACTVDEMFVMPLTLDEQLPLETEGNPRSYYPRLEGRKAT